MSRAAVALRRAPPRLGQHTDEVLAELLATQEAK
jgi:crotonobetainyl-CoA:carnitine CoA-transferase CaiB-like acyl-CoA transferase